MDSAGIPWYSTGTVNVTQGSNNVAGIGTNWVNAGLKVGDIFTIDKSRLYQITAINSNTSLSLQEAYQGATGSSQVYFVIRNFAGTMQAQIAAQVSELVNKYESYIDTELKQITGPAGPTSFPYRGTWTTGRTYNGLDVVQYGNQLYMALYGHTSTSANAPGATGTAWTGLSLSLSGTAQIGNSVNLYVATSGDDTTGDGSSSRPFATINRALNALPDICQSCSIYISPGNYNLLEPLRILKDVSLYAQNSNSRPIIKSSQPYAIIVSNACVFFSGIDFDWEYSGTDYNAGLLNINTDGSLTVQNSNITVADYGAAFRNQDGRLSAFRNITVSFLGTHGVGLFNLRSALSYCYGINVVTNAQDSRCKQPIEGYRLFGGVVVGAANMWGAVKNVNIVEGGVILS